MSPTDVTRAGKSRLVPKCAIRWALLCLVLGVPSCLNPVPDEFPSSQPVTVERESCDDNPYLVGCEPPPAEAPPELNPPLNGEEVTPPDEGEEPDAGAPPDGGPPDADVGL